jgi:hypothetical protein
MGGAMKIVLALALLVAAAPARTPSTVQRPGNGVAAPQATRQVKPE